MADFIDKWDQLNGDPSYPVGTRNEAEREIAKIRQNGRLELQDFEGRKWWVILQDDEPTWALIAREYLSV